MKTTCTLNPQKIDHPFLLVLNIKHDSIYVYNGLLVCQYTERNLVLYNAKSPCYLPQSQAITDVWVICVYILKRILCWKIIEKEVEIHTTSYKNVQDIWLEEKASKIRL